MRRYLFAAVLAMSVVGIGRSADPDGERKSLESELSRLSARGNELTGRFADVDSKLGAVVNRAEKLNLQHAQLEKGFNKAAEESAKVQQKENDLAAEQKKVNDSVGQVQRSIQQFKDCQRDHQSQGRQIENERSRLDRTSQSAVNSFNQRVREYNAAGQRLDQQAAQVDKEIADVKARQQALDRQYDALNQVKQALRERLKELNNQHMNAHSEAQAIKRDHENLSRQRQDLVNARVKLNDDMKDARQRAAAYNARVAAGQKVFYDDNAPKAGGSVTRDARTQAEEAEKQRRELEKKFPGGKP